MRRIAVIASALLAVVILSVPTTAASGWSSPERVWDAPYDMPSMAVDTDGAVHIAARGMDGIWYLTNETGRWTRVRLTRDHADAGGFETANIPLIALDPADGSLTVAYEVIPCADCAWRSYLAYRTNRHADGPGAWSAQRDIPGRGQAPTSIVVRHGVIAIAATVGDLQTRVRFFTNASGRWTHEDIEATGDRSAASPSLALDRQGRPVIAYGVYGAYPKANAIRLARGTSRTGGFTTERVVASPGAQGPSLVLDAKGRPRFSFSADDGTSVARHTASGWRQRRVWSDGSDSQLLLAAGDQPRLVGLRETPRPQAWFAAWSSGAWQRTRLTSHPTRQVAFAIEKADGRDHVVTVIGDRLWYTHSR